MPLQEGIVECVVNINHSSDPGFIERLVGKINESGAQVAHCDTGVDAQRTVLTILAYIRFVPKALEAIYSICIAEQNIHDYTGNHPSIGIVDVVPFVPIKNITKDELEPLVDQWAEVISARYDIPIIYYGGMTQSSDQEHLSQIRKGGINGATERMQNGLLQINQGPSKPNNTLGLSCWTVRDIMLAYNVSLATQDRSVIKSIAKQIRTQREHDLLLKNVKVLGWITPYYNCSQISANLYDIEEMTLEGFYELVVNVSAKRGIQVIGSELIGMTPIKGMSNDVESMNVSNLVTKLGLSKHYTFIEKDRLLEEAVEYYEGSYTSSTI